MYEKRYSKEWFKEYTWPREDVHLWRHLNKKEYGRTVPRTISRMADRKGVIIQAGGACEYMLMLILKSLERYGRLSQIQITSTA